MKVDIAFISQLAYHICRLKCDDKRFIKVHDSLIEVANNFNRISDKEYSSIKPIKPIKPIKT